MTTPKIQTNPGGPKLSRLVLGLWRLADGDGKSKQETLSLLKESLELGISSFDHADLYGGYQCEELFGNALALEPSLRQQMQLITKCGIIWPCAQRPQFGLHHYNLERDHIIASAENSLKVMRTDYLDILLVHRPSPLMDVDEIADAFVSLHRAGKVRFFGVSNFTPSQFNLLQSRLPLPLVTNQIELSLLHRQPFLDGSLDHCQQHRVAPMAWSPLGGGAIFDSANPIRQQLNPVFEELCQKYSVGIDQLLFAFLLAHPANILPILGTTKAKRVADAVKALEISLGREDWFKLWIAAEGKPVP